MQSTNKEALEEMAMDLIRYGVNNGDDSDAKDSFYEGVKLIEKLKDIEEMEMTAENQAERLEVEREKIKSQEKCEETKQQVSWKRIALELGKAVVPGVISGAFLTFLVNKTGKFEETGRWNSTASRMVQNQGPKMKY